MSNQPIVFNIRYTPYSLKANASDEEIAAHKEEREFFSMTGSRNIYSYITQGTKTGESATFLNYLEKSTGVFNKQGVISREEVANMKARLKANEGNLWHGYISFNEEKSEMIDTPEKSIRFVRSIFGAFFKEAKFDEKNMDLMCALHLDKPHHLHIHFLFWEKAPKTIGKDGKYRFRSKGRVDRHAIENLFVRSGIYVSEDRDTIKTARQGAIKALKDITSVKLASRLNAEIKKEIIQLAKDLPKDRSLGYNSKEMIPYRERIDEIVKLLIAADGGARKANRKFYVALKNRQKTIENICGKPNAFKSDEDSCHIIIDPKDVTIVEDIKKDYIRRQGNLVINLARKIRPEIFERDPKKKYKSNDARLKKRKNVSEKKITRIFMRFIKSFCNESNLLERDFSRRLQEIEEEIKRKDEEEKTRKGDTFNE